MVPSAVPWKWAYLNYGIMGFSIQISKNTSKSSENSGTIGVSKLLCWWSAAAWENVQNVLSSSWYWGPIRDDTIGNTLDCYNIIISFIDI